MANNNNITTPTEETRFASWWARFFAFLIDAVILCIAVYALIPRGPVFLFLPVAYGWLLEGTRWNATIGKLLLKLAVRSIDGKTISYAKAFERNMIKFIFFAIAFFAFVYGTKLMGLGNPYSSGIVTPFDITSKRMVLNLAMMALFFAWVFGPKLFVKRPQAVHDLLSKCIVIRVTR